MFLSHDQIRKKSNFLIGKLKGDAIEIYDVFFFKLHKKNFLTQIICKIITYLETIYFISLKTTHKWPLATIPKFSLKLKKSLKKK